MTGQWVYFRVELDFDLASVRPSERRSSSDHPREVNAPAVYGCTFAEKKRTGGWDAQGAQADCERNKEGHLTKTALLGEMVASSSSPSDDGQHFCATKGLSDTVQNHKSQLGSNCNHWMFSSYTGGRHPPVASTIQAPDNQSKARATHTEQDTKL
ncbi:uncharacterized protein AKAW2_20695S [Aspergillus luchuensis]|nr:uncharacterized protein AKAW2_20695S [Aspergillus luchuensis]BCR95755.1 hypothetical protein AKAW2_20695S [Aspergillus luchuensis]BCS08288.1 hypothetical protein ALUC_20659S [Aspergillus luchuensis]